MALTAGTVSISASGVATKSGAAGELFDLRYARLTATMAKLKSSLPAGAALQALLQPIADDSNDVAAWMVGHITANGHAKVAAAAAGLQKTPSPNDPGALTVASGSDVLLPII